MPKDHLAIYGNIKVPRSYCPRCLTWTLVISGVRQCCDSFYEPEPKSYKRISSPHYVRKQPSRKVKKQLLEEFDYACTYCDRKFDSWTRYKGELKKIRLNWDHNLPWSYSQNNLPQNFLPACNFCNSWKSSKIFKSIEEVRIFVLNRWQENEMV